MALDPIPVPTRPIHVTTHRATPYHPPAIPAVPQDNLQEDDEQPRVPSRRQLAAFWAGYIGLAVVLIGLAAAHVFAR